MSVPAALKQVFCRFGYAVSAALIALASFIFLTLIPNYRMIVSVFSDGGLRIASKIKFLAYVFSGMTESLGLLSVISAVLVSVLFGVSIVLIIYFLKDRLFGLGGKAIVSAFGGTASGALSASCAACGSFVLSAILSVVGAGGALALLPLRGGELGILSIILLGASIYLMARKIAETKRVICSV